MSTDKNTPAADPEIERAAFRALALARLIWERLLDDDGKATIAGVDSATLAAVAESLHRELDSMTDRVAAA